MTVWELMRTGTYASAFTILKPWYDAIGLKGGHVLAPVVPVPPQQGVAGWQARTAWYRLSRGS